MKTSKIVVIFLILLAFFGFFYFDFAKFLTLEGLKTQQALISNDLDEHYLYYFGSFCLVYIIATAISLPGAAILTLLGGGLFGLFWGTLAVSFSSTMGATIAFWSARFLFRDTVEKKFSKSLEKINTGVEKEGGLYLFTIRLTPVFPFFVVNLLMGLTKIKTLTYMWVSALGMLPGTIVYVNAGTQLSQLESTRSLLSPKLIGAFLILGLFPLISKKLLQAFRKKPIKEVHS